jgi:diguanylate cyclase (GGDEF)-like protein
MVFASASRWAVWSVPSRVRALVLLVELGTVALVLADVLSDRPSTADVVLGCWILGLGMVHIEAATGIERARRRVADTAYFDLSSVWTFAAALLLPPLPATGVVVVLYLHLWLRVWKPARVPLYRLVYTAATVVLAARTAHEVIAAAGGIRGWPDDLPALGAIVVAALLYLVVNNALVAGAVALAGGRRRPAELLGGLDDNILEVATLCLGALAALALVTNRWTVLLAVPPLLVLHRAVHVRQLEEAASTDAKTGLLNSAAWRAEAGRALERARRSGSAAAVLIADLDHFKAVNDTHGHLVGDAVLAAVAEALRAEVRHNDLVARFGGEEFVVLIPDLPGTGTGRNELFVVAERIRRRIAGLGVPVDTPDGVLTVAGLSISVGGAAFPADGDALEPVLAAADASLYTAKNAGRNTVRFATLPRVPAARRPTG